MNGSVGNSFSFSVCLRKRSYFDITKEVHVAFAMVLNGDSARLESIIVNVGCFVAIHPDLYMVVFALYTITVPFSFFVGVLGYCVKLFQLTFAGRKYPSLFYGVERARLLIEYFELVAYGSFITAKRDAGIVITQRGFDLCYEFEVAENIFVHEPKVFLNR